MLLRDEVRKLPGGAAERGGSHGAPLRRLGSDHLSRGGLLFVWSQRDHLGKWAQQPRCLFGVKHWFTRTVDLARFNRVVLTDFEVSYKDSAPTRRTRVELHTLAGGIELGSGPMTEGTVELGERLREWCAIAASEAP